MDFIRVSTADHVTTVTLDRPEVMNAINGAMHHELQAAFDDFAADPDQYICVVTGAGPKAFCAGSDLKAAVAARGEPFAYPKNGYAGLAERFDCAKPLIAAVNGLALGGGFEVALACDVVIAVDTASFGLPEPLVGAIAFGGGLQRLAREIGPKRALGMILTARRVSAAEGYRLGFVNEVVAPGELDAAVARWCAEMLRAAPPALRASKEAVYRGLDASSLQAALASQADYPAYAAWASSEDLKEGPTAFAEKRAPVWVGR
ncbi:MAG: enoyl-CoA hydratase [Sphingomonadales bacterium]|nr:enoyl-CoA hydratase [Sphingomonadales bacterium]